MTKDFKGKRLYRSQSNKMIAGVCGGIADYFEIDPTLIRLIVVAIALFGGVGLLAYIAAIFIIPNNPNEEPSENSSESLIKDKSLFWGSLLVILGLFFLLRQMGLFYGFEFWHIPWQMVWAIFLIGIGLYLLYNRNKKDNTESNSDVFELKGKKLYRSGSQKMLAGVCGGIAEYFEMDVSIIRILWAIITIASAGFGILIYILMIIIFPENPENVEDKEIQV